MIVGVALRRERVAVLQHLLHRVEAVRGEEADARSIGMNSMSASGRDGRRRPRASSGARAGPARTSGTGSRRSPSRAAIELLEGVVVVVPSTTSASVMRRNRTTDYCPADAALCRKPGVVGPPRPAGRRGRHDDRARLQPHLPGRQDQGHRRLVREPRDEARDLPRLAREHHRARGRRRARRRTAHAGRRGRAHRDAGGRVRHEPPQGRVLRLPPPDRGLGVHHEPGRGVVRDRVRRARAAGRSTTRSTSGRTAGGASSSRS